MDIGNYLPHDFLRKRIVEIEHAIGAVILVGDRVAVDYLPALLLELCKVPNRNLTDLLGKFDAIHPGKREFEHGQHGAAFSAANIQNGVLIADVEIFQESNKIFVPRWGGVHYIFGVQPDFFRLHDPGEINPLNYFLDEQRLAQDVLGSELADQFA